MRHIRVRRRIKFILILLYVFTLVLFFEEKLGSFTPQLKHIVEARAEEALNDRFTLSIGNMEGGVFRPLTLNDVRIHDKKLSSIISSLEIKSVKLDYRVWDVFFKKARSGSLFGLLSTLRPFDRLMVVPSKVEGRQKLRVDTEPVEVSKEPSTSVTFVTKNNEFSGFVNLKGNIEKSDIKGYFLLFGDQRLNFTGKIRGRLFEMELKFKTAPVKIEGELLDDGYLKTGLSINHLKVCGADVVAKFILKNRFVKDELCSRGDYLEGELETKNLIVNYTPFLDFRASYRVRNGILEIHDMTIDEEFKAYGSISLKSPYNLNFTMVANNANLMKVWASFGAGQNAVLTGIMNSKFEFKGPVDRVRTVARMLIRDGKLGDVDFKNLEANLAGDGPIVTIEDSRITRSSGYFALAGKMDMRKLGTSSMFQDIRIAADERAIVWDNWNTEKIQGAKEIKMEKRMSEEVYFGFKKFIPDDRVDESLRDKDEIEVEYKVHPKESLKMMFGSDGGNFFGLEHKDKF